MINNPVLLEAYNRQRIAQEAPDYFESLRIYEEMYLFACELGAFPREDPLAGLEVDLRLARVLNADL